MLHTCNIGVWPTTCYTGVELHAIQVYMYIQHIICVETGVIQVYQIYV